MEWRVPWPWVGFLASLAVLAHQAIALLHGDAPSFLASMWQVGVMAVGMASLSLILLPPRRLSFALGFLVCAALMGWALWLQFGEGLEPCPLCQFQRVAVVLIGLTFLVGTLHEPGQQRIVEAAPPLGLDGGGGRGGVGFGGRPRRGQIGLRAPVLRADGAAGQGAGEAERCQQRTRRQTTGGFDARGRDGTSTHGLAVTSVAAACAAAASAL